MKEKRYNWKIWFMIILFGSVLLLAARVVYMLATNQVVYESNLPVPFAMRLILCFMIILVCSTYAYTAVMLLWKVLKRNSVAFAFDNNGLHDPLIIVNVLAFVFTARIKYIPWSSVTYMDEENGNLYIRVKKSEITAGFFGRLLIWICGYHFNSSMLKEKLTSDDIKNIRSYISKNSKHINNQ